MGIYSLNFLNGVIERDHIVGSIIGLTKGDARSLNYGSYAGGLLDSKVGCRVSGERIHRESKGNLSLGWSLGYVLRGPQMRQIHQVLFPVYHRV